MNLEYKTSLKKFSKERISIGLKTIVDLNGMKPLQRETLEKESNLKGLEG